MSSRAGTSNSATSSRTTASENVLNVSAAFLAPAGATNALVGDAFHASLAQQTATLRDGRPGLSLTADNFQARTYNAILGNPHATAQDASRSVENTVMTTVATSKVFIPFKSRKARQALIGVFTNITNFLVQEKYKKAICAHFGISSSICKSQLGLIKKSIENITKKFSKDDCKEANRADLQNTYKEIIYLLAPNLQEAENRNQVYEKIESIFLIKGWYETGVASINHIDFLNLANKDGAAPPQEIQQLRLMIQYLNKVINDAFCDKKWSEIKDYLKMTLHSNGVTLIPENIDEAQKLTLDDLTAKLNELDLNSQPSTSSTSSATPSPQLTPLTKEKYGKKPKGGKKTCH